MFIESLDVEAGEDTENDITAPTPASSHHPHTFHFSTVLHSPQSEQIYYKRNTIKYFSTFSTDKYFNSISKTLEFMIGDSQDKIYCFAEY